MIMMNKNEPSVAMKSSQSGFVLVLALLVMVILSLLGTLSLRIANTEVITAGGTEGSIASFYMLEAVALTGVAHLEHQNVSGEDCLEAHPQYCRVKELFNVETTDLDWLDELYTGDVTKPVFDLTVLDPSIKDDDTKLPRLRKFPDNWYGEGQRSSRLPASLQSDSDGNLEPIGYVDREDGGDDLIRFAVQDNGRIGAYSIGSDDSIIKNYKIYGLYYVGADGSRGYPGKFSVEMGYRMELVNMEVM